MKMSAIWQPYLTKDRPCQRNRLNGGNPNEPEHGQPSGEAALQNTRTFQNEASAAHGSLAMEIRQDLRRSCGRATDTTKEIEQHMPRTLRDVRVIQRPLAIQNSWKSAILSLTDFTIQFRVKISTLKMYSCA
jgi:hypothetical protein